IDPAKRPSKTHSTFSAAAFNYMNSILGSGVIGMSFALKETGIGLGIMLLVFVGIINDISLVLMVKGGNLAGVSTYQDLMMFAFGRKGFYVLTVLQFIYPIIAMISYNIVIGDTWSRLMVRLTKLPPTHAVCRREFVIVVMTLLCTLPMSLYRNITKLGKISLVSVVFLVLILIIIVARFVTLGDLIEPTPDAWSFANSGITRGIGVMSFAYMCHHNSFLLYNSMDERSLEKWEKVTHISVAASAVFIVIFGTFGYATFTGLTQGDLLENYCQDDDLVNVARAIFSVTVMMTFPIECFVAREVIERTFWSAHDTITLEDGVERIEAATPWYRHMVITVGTVVFVCIVTLFVDCLGAVLELNGLLAAIPLAYILPTACFIRIDSSSPRTSKLKLMAYVCCVFGVLVSFVGLIMFIIDYSSDSVSSCSHGTEMPYCPLPIVSSAKTGLAAMAKNASLTRTGFGRS
ncbi:unnamed protein product, partial [Notodromas monacha]